MDIEELLQKLEDFLDKDLKGEKLSTKAQGKRKQLAAKVRDALEHLNKDKLEKFLNEQREKTRNSVPDTRRPTLPLPQVPPLSSNANGTIEEAVVEDLYMDLNDPGLGDDSAGNGSLAVASPSDGGSGSGYESYASDEDTSARSKAAKENEQLSRYFAGTDCEVYSFVFVENKTFLSGKKWLKRVGVVRENHFQCFKKLGDTHPVLDLPLRTYSAYLSSKDGTNSVIINLEGAGSHGEGCRFYVEYGKSDEWNRVMREKAGSVVQTGSLPPPPVVTRPTNTLPPAERPMTRQSSLGVADLPKVTINDQPVRMNGDPASPPTVGKNNIGKGLKSAVSDMFKKDKTKKKISVAEQLGADLCGGLAVCIDGRWSKKFCVIKNNDLLVYGKEEAPEITLPLHGCDLHPYFEDPEKRFTFKLTENGVDMIFLSANSSEEMGKWIGKLIAETGCADVPEAPNVDESIYVEPELYQSVMDRAREVFQQTVRLKTQAKKMAKHKRSDSSEESQQAAESLYMDLDVSNAPPSLLSRTRNQQHARPQSATLSYHHQQSNSKTSEDILPPLKARPKKTPPPVSPPTAPKSRSASDASPSQPPTRFNFKKTRGGSDSTDKITASGAKQGKTPLSAAREIATSPMQQDKVAARFSHAEAQESDGGSQAKEAESRLQEINQKLDVLTVRESELGKYAEACKTPKEQAEVDKLLKRVKVDSDKLRAEKIDVEMELRKAKSAADRGANSAGKRKPPQRPRGASNPATPTGNVMSRAKMFENL